MKRESGANPEQCPLLWSLFIFLNTTVATVYAVYRKKFYLSAENGKAFKNKKLVRKPAKRILNLLSFPGSEI